MVYFRSRAAAERLKHTRWAVLRRGSRVRGRAREKLKALRASKLATARAWELKETFGHFWTYRSVVWAGAFLDYWTWRALRSRLQPMKKVAHMLRSHEELLLNWFRAKGEISSGAVEGLNNKIRVVTRRSYGFRTYAAMEVALYHTLGRLPEPQSDPQILLRRPKTVMCTKDKYACKVYDLCQKRLGSQSRHHKIRLLWPSISAADLK